MRKLEFRAATMLGDYAHRKQMQFSLRKLIVLTCILLFSTVIVAQSENDPLVVINHVDSPLKTLTKKQVVDIYMGRAIQLPTNERVLALDYEDSENLREAFYLQLIGMNTKRVNAYWSRLLFSGRALPPSRVVDLNSASELLTANLNAIAFTRKSDLPKGFKVLFEFENEKVN
ncbi:hypothetical protein [Glaciecola sp. 1036]|uniref:hypothetical protein n=1 Tax=Alteromonadaceae TaxID=72275 RepID=UPI003CFF45B4